MSEDVTERSLQYRRNMIGLNGTIILRWIGVTTSLVSIEFNGFCDASRKAYGACLYDVRLLTAKSQYNTVGHYDCILFVSSNKYKFSIDFELNAKQNISTYIPFVL